MASGAAEKSLRSRHHKKENGNVIAQAGDALPVRPALLTVLDYAFIVSLLFGGCCSNAWTLEMLLRQSSDLGSALTFSQMAFNALLGLPSFLTFRRVDGGISLFPRFKPRAIPLSTWLVQVLLLLGMSLLNNWAFAFHVPLTLQIIIRSSGLAVSMLFGYFTMNRKYNYSQIVSAAMVTGGVILATLSAPMSSDRVDMSHLRQYSFGVSMLMVSSLLTGYYGTLQEKTYTHYGPHWQEGVFYTHLFSLPMFIFLKSDIKRGFSKISAPDQRFWGIPSSYILLSLNIITQLLCTSSVNKLSTRVSSVSTNLVLTARKALSLCISVWWFHNPWDWRLSVGATMVFIGTIYYARSGSKRSENQAAGKRLN